MTIQFSRLAMGLKPDDIIFFTKEKVISVATSGISIPSGKVELVLESSKTKTQRKVNWNQTTKIRIEEPS